MEKTALVFSGGGARGSYEVGVWEAMEELGIRADIVTGTSVGTLNGAMYAQGELEKAKKLWSEITTDMVFRVEEQERDGRSAPAALRRAARAFFQNMLKSGGLDSSPLKELLAQCVDEEKVRRSGVELGIVTVETGERVVPRELFVEDIPRGRLIDYLLASCSMYPAIRPYEIDGVAHVDGGYYDNLPVRMAAGRGAARIVAVDIEAIGFVRWGLVKRMGNVTIVRSYWKHGPLLQFERESARRNIRLGYLDAMKRFGAYEGCAYTFRNGTGEALAALFGEPAELAYGLGFPGADQLVRLAFPHVERYFALDEEEETTYPLFCLSCAELAGELLGVDYEEVYDRESFDRALAQAVGERRSQRGEEGGLLAGAAEFLRGLALLRDGGARALLMADRLAELRRDGKQLGGPAFAAVMRSEYLAALYLLFSGLAGDGAGR